MKRLLLVLVVLYSNAASATTFNWVDASTAENAEWEIDCQSQEQRIIQFTNTKTGVLVTQISECGYYLGPSVLAPLIAASCP